MAASPLPGHLIAGLGHAGHSVAVALLGAGALAFAIWLVRRPPRDYAAVAVRLAVAYAIMFTLAPATRFGYYIYPLALLCWLPLSGTTMDTERSRLTVLLTTLSHPWRANDRARAPVAASRYG